MSLLRRLVRSRRERCFGRHLDAIASYGIDTLLLVGIHGRHFSSRNRLAVHRYVFAVRTRSKNFDEIPRTEYLLLQQKLGHLIELLSLLDEEDSCALADTIDDDLYLLIDDARRVFRIGLSKERAVPITPGEIEAHV